MIGLTNDYMVLKVNTAHHTRQLQSVGRHVVHMRWRSQAVWVSVEDDDSGRVERADFVIDNVDVEFELCWTAWRVLNHSYSLFGFKQTT